MGCAQSKIDNEESVLRCRERKRHMKDAVSARNAFAAAHSSYVVSLRSTGAALSEYGQAEMAPVLHPTSAPSSSSADAAVAAVAAVSAVAAVAPPPIDNLPPPPPPLPDFSPSPLQRSASMPDLPPPKPLRRRNPNQTPPSPSEGAILEEDADGDDELEETEAAGGSSSGAPRPPPSPPRRETPPPPENKETWDYFFAMDDNIHMPPAPNMIEEEIRQTEERVEEDRFKRASTSDSSAAVASSAAAGVADSPPVTPEKVVLDTPHPSLPPKPAKKPKQGGSVHHQHAASAGASEVKRGKMVPSATPSVNLVLILYELDDHFLKASESAQKVTGMLEATRLHYHSNFADNRGHIDHSARVMRVITWNRSFKGMPNADDDRDDFDNEKWETHATILDKLLAWEKKLYDEVKAGELMKIEYQRKVALLNKHKKRGTNPEALEKTKAAVSHLHTRYIVDMQSMDSTVSEIQRLRDDRLYPKLTALVDGMAQMWESMHAHHDSQLKMVIDLKTVDISCIPKETNKQHFDRTAQLHDIALEWHLHFQKLVTHQKEYIIALNSWLKLNLIPIESSLKEKVSSPPRVHQPPIQALLHAWHDLLEKLPDEIAKNAIYSFAAVMNAIMVHQQEEMKQKERCEDLRKDYHRKERSFGEWYQKNATRWAPSEEADPDQGNNANHKDHIAERKLAVETAKKLLEEEEDAYQKLCKQVREKSVTSLKTQLPELFRAMSDFSFSCSQMYKHLRAITQAQNRASS